MRTEVISGRDLDTAVAERWRAIQDGNAALASPCFSPEFAQAASAVRRDARVAILEDAGRTVAYFPHHRLALGICKPIGAELSDFNGLIAEDGVKFEVPALMRACGCGRYEFYHQVECQSPFAAYVTKHAGAPFMDLSHGFDKYAGSRREHGTLQLKKVDNLARKLEREVGALRFAADVRDVSVMNRLYELKSRQYRETGLADVFAIPWKRDFIERLLDCRAEGCAGVLSALWAGEHLIALHFGLRSKTVLNYWFPTYDPGFARYSPGLILLLRLAEWCARQGIVRIDLGKGAAFYKKRFASGEIPLVEGVYDSTLVLNRLLAFRRILYGLRHGKGIMATVADTMQKLEMFLRKRQRP